MHFTLRSLLLLFQCFLLGISPNLTLPNDIYLVGTLLSGVANPVFMVGSGYGFQNMAAFGFQYLVGFGSGPGSGSCLNIRV